MNRKNNKENLRTIVLNAPKIKLKLNNQPINYPFIETQRSPKVNELYQKIQQSIECNTDAIQQKEQNHNDKISYHQQKIREKLRKYKYMQFLNYKQKHLQYQLKNQKIHLIFGMIMSNLMEI